MRRSKDGTDKQGYQKHTSKEVSVDKGMVKKGRETQGKKQEQSRKGRRSAGISKYITKKQGKRNHKDKLASMDFE